MLALTAQEMRFTPRISGDARVRRVILSALCIFMLRRHVPFHAFHALSFPRRGRRGEQRDRDLDDQLEHGVRGGELNSGAVRIGWRVD